MFNQTTLNITSSKLILDETKLRPIVNKMNYGNVEMFKTALKLHTGNVRKIFSKLLS
jgi:hypothetical protein